MTGESTARPVNDVVARPAAPAPPACDAVVVMGVAGCGKSTVGAALARRLAWPHLDADDFHPRDNVEKMRSGTPLTDADRGPWLASMRAELDRRVEAGDPVVLACSALKRAYRDVLRDGIGVVRFLHLRAEREQLGDRLSGRGGHFFPAALIDSQLATLEEPDGDEQPLVVAATETPAAIVDRALRFWAG